MTRGWGALVALTATSILLAGCTGDDEPEEPATPSTAASSPSETSPTSEPSPREPPPTLPPEAQGADDDGAAAFLRYYFDVVNYANASGDVAPLEAISDPECQSCDNLIQEARDGYDDGGGLEDGVVTIQDVVVTPGDIAFGLEARAVLDQSAGRWTDSDGDVVREFPALEDYFLGAILDYDGTWRLSEWGDADEL